MVLRDCKGRDVGCLIVGGGFLCSVDEDLRLLWQWREGVHCCSVKGEGHWFYEEGEGGPDALLRVLVHFGGRWEYWYFVGAGEGQ